MNLAIIYVGLVQEFLSVKQAIQFINSKYVELNCDEEILIKLNLSDDHRDEFSRILSEVGEVKRCINNKPIYETAMMSWRLSKLLEVKSSDRTREEKLIDIAVLWANFDYPVEWEPFIYYMPSERKQPCSPYDAFLQHLDQQCLHVQNFFKNIQR